MSKPVLLHYNLVNATLVRETNKAVLIKCNVLTLTNKELPTDIWFPKAKCKLVNNVWQVDAKFMRIKAMEIGSSIHSQEVWG